MTALPSALYDEVYAALIASGHDKLAGRLVAFRGRDVMSSGQAAKRLGAASANTIKNWLESGQFPGAYKTSGGHWRFPVDEVEAVRARLDALALKSRTSDLVPPDLDDGEDPPLL